MPRRPQASLEPSDRGGDPAIFRKRADLSGDAELVYQAEGVQLADSISADGTVLLFWEVASVPPDIGMLSLDGDPDVRMLLTTEAGTVYPSISPDGRFFAFRSNETGGSEIHVQEIETGSRWTISTGGARRPVWARGGTEILYQSGPGQRSVVEVTREPELSFSAPRQLFEVAGFQSQYDVTADGQRFLGTVLVADTEVEPAGPQINVILNWFEELRQRVPVGR